MVVELVEVVCVVVWVVSESDDMVAILLQLLVCWKAVEMVLMSEYRPNMLGNTVWCYEEAGGWCAVFVG